MDKIPQDVLEFYEAMKALAEQHGIEAYNVTYVTKGDQYRFFGTGQNPVITAMSLMTADQLPNAVRISNKFRRQREKEQEGEPSPTTETRFGPLYKN